MEINKETFDCAGIYAIKNIINGKIYVGKSKNCYKRLHQHKTDLTIDHRNYNENQHLLNAYKLYGDDKFYCYILEKFDNNLNNLEELLSIRELFWMKELKTLDNNSSKLFKLLSNFSRI